MLATYYVPDHTPGESHTFPLHFEICTNTIFSNKKECHPRISKLEMEESHEKVPI